MTETDDRERGRPLSEDQEGPLAKEGWHGGATFFEESGGRPAQASAIADSGAGSNSRDSLPASEAGTGIIPEDRGSGSSDVHRPASEEDSTPPERDKGGETQSWPGRSFGSIPPPG